MDAIDQLLKDIDEQLAQGVTDPVGLLEQSAKTIRALRLEALQAKPPCLSCGHTPGTGSGVGPMGIK